MIPGRVAPSDITHARTDTARTVQLIELVREAVEESDKDRALKLLKAAWEHGVAAQDRLKRIEQEQWEPPRGSRSAAE